MPKTFAEYSKEELKEIVKRGNAASIETRRKRKAMKENLKILLSMPLNKGKVADIEDIKAFAELKGKNVTVDEAILIKLIQKALSGDLNALLAIRDTIGEKPYKEDW